MKQQTEMENFMLRKGMFLADRYEILEQIGTGGMSDVYRAKCHKLNRFVAIKVLKKEYSEDKTFVSKFRAEAQAAAGLTHPNIVNVYDVGDENGIYYIVMELVEGITLKKYIEKKGKIPYKEAVSIAIQVAKGMQAAHSHHIVHRDIKPQNIIISRDGKVKVTDFGIAKAASSSTITSSTMGSVHYISPEQARGGYSDERSDIYSFGITLFEMLTGTVPFDGDSTVSVAVQHIQEEIPRPSTVADGIPVSIDMIVLKCTQKKTERRYQDAAELIADLKKSLVAPDENFVKMMPVYNAPGQPETVQAAEESSENNDEQENQNSNESMAENKKDSEDIDDELLDDELLDDDDDAEVDLSSQAFQIWKSATDARPELKQIIPNLQNMIYSTKATDSKLNNGVITYARTANDFDLLTWLDSEGNFVTQSQKKILQALACNSNEQYMPPMDNHHELVEQAVSLIKTQSTTVTGGILGNRFSTRYRIITLLEHYYEQSPTLFFSDENRQLLKLAIDDIYNYPLLEGTKFILGRMLRASSKTASDDIVEYILEMRKSGSLCRIEEENTIKKENTIICSMGIKYTE